MEGWVARSGRGREGREDLGQLGGPTRGYVVIGVNGLGTRGACHATVRSARVLEMGGCIEPSCMRGPHFRIRGRVSPAVEWNESCASQALHACALCASTETDRARRKFENF